MAISLEDVEHIANLARINLTEDEKFRFREQLSAILDYVAQLQKVDTTTVEPMAMVFKTDDPLRPDEVRPGLTTGELLGAADQVARSQFKIPPVFE